MGGEEVTIAPFHVDLLDRQGREVSVPVWRPTREQVEQLKEGDRAPYAFGEGTVVEVYARGYDQFGKAYACYYVGWGVAGRMSASIKEGEVVRTLRLCSLLNSSQIAAMDLK